MLNDTCFAIGIILLFQIKTLPIGLLFIVISLILKKKKLKKFDDITYWFQRNLFLYLLNIKIVKLLIHLLNDKIQLKLRCIF